MNTLASPAFEQSNVAKRRILWASEVPTDIRFIGSTKSDFPFFDDILRVRAATDRRWPAQETNVDEYSDHYGLYLDDNPIGALGVTRALNGRVYFQEKYPPNLFDSFLDRIVSAYRFRLLAQFHRTSSLAGGINFTRVAIRETWREHISRGAGIDIINVEQKYVSYYSRLGYILCEDYDFVCPVFQQLISVMFLSTDPTRKSIIQDLIQDRDDHVFVADVTRSITRKQVSVPSHESI